jgi:xanthine dehydrogenase YagS FAD-binding subunit
VKIFKHINADSIEEAVAALEHFNGKAMLIAGGTDIIGKMKDYILPEYPEALINIKSIQGLDFVKEEKDKLRIGAMTRLHDLSVNETVKSRYTALAEAAGRTASPNIRQMGTIGGNICQDIRCWFYRAANNRFQCLRKGGGRCYAIKGDSRFHSIFGASVSEGCFAVHPSDTAPALIALDAEIKTTNRTIKAEDFFAVKPRKTTVLENNEIVTEIIVPAPAGNAGSSFIKFAVRKSIDFPIVNCAAMISSSNGKVETARICLNAVYVKPYRAVKAEEAILGKLINEENAGAAGLAAAADARPLKDNAYMVKLANTLIKRSIIACNE